MKSLILGVLLFSIFNVAARAELRGDPEAVALANRMIERLGGAEAWSEARSLYLEYDGWRGDISQPVMERAWRDLAEPRQRLVFESRRAEAILIVTPDVSWIEHSETGVQRQSDNTHNENLYFWNFDFYTMIRNLAAGDERLFLEFKAPQTIEIKGPNEGDWGWFEIDQTGQPIRWGAPDGDDTLEYIYGPVKAFGNVNFPEWGTAADGFWRFNYRVVDISKHPLEGEFSFPPEK